MDIDSSDPATSAWRLLCRRSYGVLSTQSLDVEGYPFGSLTSYVLDQCGVPVLLISRLAQHTKNLLADDRVSLTVVDEVTGDPQEAARLTWLGHARPVAEGDAAMLTHYERFQPQARQYVEELDFGFFRIEPVTIRHIGGFGKISWVAPQQLYRQNPFAAEAVAGVLAHMNADHQDALRIYCRMVGVDCADHMLPVMCGVDAEGCHIRLEQRIIRVPFPHAVADAGALRQVLVELARAGRSSE